MKKFVVASLVALAGTAAHSECSISFHAHGAVTSNLKAKGWNLEQAKYDEVCRKLNQANAEVVISGQATVLGGVSVGWVVVAVGDRATDLTIPNYVRLNTSIDRTTASMDRAEQLQYEALMDAMTGWDVGPAIQELNAVRKKSKSL